jgi:hypothetical protein
VQRVRTAFAVVDVVLEAVVEVVDVEAGVLEQEDRPTRIKQMPTNGATNRRTDGLGERTGSWYTSAWLSRVDMEVAGVQTDGSSARTENG